MGGAFDAQVVGTNLKFVWLDNALIIDLVVVILFERSGYQAAISCDQIFLSAISRSSKL